MGRLAWLSIAALLVPATARATYSIVAADGASGQVGGAVTSCVGAQGVGVVYRPSVGHGGVNAQATASASGRDQAVLLLGMNVAPADIISMITASAFDPNAATRQYGVVDLMGRSAGFTGTGAQSYKEDRQGTAGSYTYSVQGNILTSKNVIDHAETAFRTTGCDLADKLMLALEAGATGGEGDSRCTPNGIPSDAASVEVDRGGETAGSFLKLSVAGTGRTSAVVQIRAMFDSWRAAHPCSSGGAGGAGGAGGTGASGGGGAAGGRGGATTGGSGGATTSGSGGGPTAGGGGGCSCEASGPRARSPGAGASIAVLLLAAAMRPRRARPGTGVGVGGAF